MTTARQLWHDQTGALEAAEVEVVVTLLGIGVAVETKSICDSEIIQL